MGPGLLCSLMYYAKASKSIPCKGLVEQKNVSDLEHAQVFKVEAFSID